jgi:hypothetical protein
MWLCSGVLLTRPVSLLCGADCCRSLRLFLVASPFLKCSITDASCVRAPCTSLPSVVHAQSRRHVCCRVCAAVLHKILQCHIIITVYTFDYVPRIRSGCRVRSFMMTQPNVNDYTILHKIPNRDLQ